MFCLEKNLQKCLTQTHCGFVKCDFFVTYFFWKKKRGGDESLSKISSYDNTLFVSQLKYVTIYLLVDFQASY